ncbi:hypothetical protein RHGRI_019708 [Rhododendron griersonianum]|uniref:Uncharacterized protein n=1 Tax=Rhododendron griersonianum TaxID=479676 RepID=A0AAV6JEN3_9ERIC|nr:hypothetical protein RHGRI_019708 [Rhododendron griersonianum]
MNSLKLHETGKQLPSSEDVQSEAEKSLQQSNRQRTTRNAELILRCGKGKQFNLGNFQKAPEKSLKQSTGERVSEGESVQEIEARKKIQVVEFIDLPQTATTCAKTHRAKEHMRSQKAYPKPSNRDEEAIELRLKATKRKLHERFEQAQNAWKKIQVVEFIDLPQTATTCAKTHRAKEHMRSQKAYVGCFK